MADSIERRIGLRLGRWRLRITARWESSWWPSILPIGASALLGQELRTEVRAGPAAVWTETWRAARG